MTDTKNLTDQVIPNTASISVAQIAVAWEITKSKHATASPADRWML